MGRQSVHDKFVAGLDARQLTIDLWSTGQNFLGHDVAQRPIDLLLWDRFLQQRTNLRSIVELGSAAFGLSLFLALQAKQRGLEFRTFDYVPNDNIHTPLSRLVGLRDDFVLGDIFGDAKPKLIHALIEELPHPLLLFCDDGDKPKEFREFVPYLNVGDYVGVHDWGVEINAQDVQIFGDAVAPLYWSEWASVGSITRFMKVVEKCPFSP